MTKLYAALAVIALLAIGEGLLLWKVYDAGENKVDRQDLVAVQRHDQQTAAQAAKDKQDASDTITNLRKQLADSLLPAPAMPVRLCVVARGSNEGRASSSTTAGAQPGEPARPADDRRVLAGDRPGPDVSADVRALADAGVICDTYRRATVAWALKQAVPIKPTRRKP